MAHQSKCSKCGHMHRTSTMEKRWLLNGFYSYWKPLGHPQAKLVSIGKGCAENIFKEQGDTFIQKDMQYDYDH